MSRRSTVLDSLHPSSKAGCTYYMRYHGIDWRSQVITSAVCIAYLRVSFDEEIILFSIEVGICRHIGESARTTAHYGGMEKDRF